MMTKPKLKKLLAAGKVRVTWNKVNEDETEVTGIFSLHNDHIPADKQRKVAPSATEYRLGAWDCEKNEWHTLGIPITRVTAATPVEE